MVFNGVSVKIKGITYLKDFILTLFGTDGVRGKAGKEGFSNFFNAFGNGNRDLF